MRTAKFVRDQNVENFKARLKGETDPTEVRRLEAMIEEEETIYQAAARILQKRQPQE